MKSLIEDYKGKLKTINEKIEDLNEKEDSVDTVVRLTVKASCYKNFISELEKENKKRFISLTGNEFGLNISENNFLDTKLNADDIYIKHLADYGCAMMFELQDNNLKQIKSEEHF